MYLIYPLKVDDLLVGSPRLALEDVLAFIRKNACKSLQFIIIEINFLWDPIFQTYLHVIVMPILTSVFQCNGM